VLTAAVLVGNLLGPVYNNIAMLTITCLLEIVMSNKKLRCFQTAEIKVKLK